MRHCTQCGASAPDDARFCPRCGAPVSAPAVGDPMLGKVIADRYQLVEKIGQGGSGTIYRGEHTTLRRRVAVKVLHSQLSTDDTALERFRREATTVAELDNEHLLQVIDFGRTEDQRLFFAMEFLEGETLTKMVERDKQLPVERAVDILTQIAEALMDAHGLGYVHRDLRPRNIFLINKRGRANFVKLLDFGLAKLVLPNVEVKQTAMGMTFGDPRYMSPEQARGEALDRRSDIYSLGAIAFEMLTGAPPYSGNGTFEILQQHLDAPVPRVRERRGDCPEWLDAVVQRALAKKPDGRFVTVLKLLESLREGKAPATVDAAEKAEHAKLSSERPAPQAQPAAAPAPGPVQSMGPAPTPAAAVDQLPPRPAASPRETQTMTTLSAPTAPKSAAQAKPDQKKEKEKPRQKDKEQKATALTPGSSASGSVDVTPAPRTAVDANVPSVVVESSSAEKTVPSRVPLPDPALPAPGEPVSAEQRPVAAPLPPPPAVEPTRRRADPTGEWFSSDSQPIRTVRGVSYDEELDELPKKNRGPMIIAGVMGGLIFVGVTVIALLPKPEHKPLRGEEAMAEKAAPSGAAVVPSGAQATAVTAPSPSGATASPSGAATSPSGAAASASGAAVSPSGAAASPSGVVAASPSGVAASPSGAIAKPATTTTPAVSPSAVAAKPAVAAPAVAVPPSAVASKPAASPPAIVARPTPPVAEKAAPVEKPAPKEAPAHVEKIKPAAPERAVRVAAVDEKRKKDKPSADGFKDPFASDAPKATAPSAGESAQAEFFVKLGRQKLNSSDLPAAAANFSKAREYDVRSSEAVAGLGEVAFEQGDYSAAAVHLKQALRLAPNRARYLILLGQAYYKLGKAKEAVSEYKKALRVEPSNSEAQHSLEVAERKLQSGG